MNHERSRDLYDRALSVMPGGVNSAVRAAIEPYPFFVERGDGGHVIDADGNRYVDWVQGLGPAGPLVYAGIYLLVTVLMIPAAAFSIVAGALFGLFWGTVSVWLGANVGAALAFLIARYLARQAVERRLAGFPKFKAIDRAVAEGGWKIVAMLRLSPAVPFNVQNYLYGLTGIRFWSCVGATAIAMLPGIFLYVYLGYAGRASIEAAAAGEVQGGMGQTILFIVGLLATLAVTVYITRLARHAIAQQTELEPMEQDGQPQDEQAATEPTKRSPWLSAGILGGLALIVLTTAACAQLRPGWITQWFGPPAVTMAEAYDISVAPHCPLGPIALAPSVQVDATVSNAFIQEQSLNMQYNDRGGLREYLSNPHVLDYEGGTMELPSGPGLGVEIDEERVRSRSEDSSEWSPPLWRTDDGVLAEW